MIAVKNPVISLPVLISMSLRFPNYEACTAQTLLKFPCLHNEEQHMPESGIPTTSKKKSLVSTKKGSCCGLTTHTVLLIQEKYIVSYTFLQLHK